MHPCMASGIVQFREDQEELDYLRGRGINPNQLAREAFEAALNRIRAEERYEKIRDIRLKFPEPPEELVRRNRDSR